MKTFAKLVLLVLIVGVLFVGAQMMRGGAPKMSNIVSIPVFNFESENDFYFNASKFIKMNSNGTTNVTMKAYKNVPNGLGALINTSTNSLGITASWYRKGYNWLDLIPKKEQLPFDGIVKTIDVWVWGGNFNYTLELHLKDYNDYQYVLPLGSLQFFGWQNLTTEIASSIPQLENYVPRRKGLTLLKMRFYSTPTERVDRFHVFLDYFKIVTDTYRDSYDGYELEKVIANEFDQGPKNPIYSASNN